jgi:hypothetical protein
MPARARDTRSQVVAWDTLQAALAAAAADSMAAAVVVDFTAVVAADTGKISFNSAEKRPANLPAVSVFGV